MEKAEALKDDQEDSEVQQQAERRVARGGGGGGGGHGRQYQRQQYQGNGAGSIIKDGYREEDYVSAEGVRILLPILDPNDPERLVYFEMSIVKYVAFKFGNKLESIFTKGKYVEPVAKPTEPQSSRTQGPSVLETKIFEAQVSEYVKALQRQGDKKLELFGFLMTRMSDASVTSVSAHTPWDDLLTSGCPLELWKSIKATHRAGVAGSDETRRSLVIERWYSLKQREEELIYQFKAKFHHMIQTMKEFGIAVPSEKELALIFVRKLSSRYAEYVQELDHLVQQKAIKYPETVEEAFSSAANSKYGRAEASALVTNPQKQPKKSVRTTGEAIFNAMSDAGDEKKRIPKCFNCKKKGHIARECPLKQAQKDTMMRIAFEPKAPTKYVDFEDVDDLCY